jgi:benzoyl-CoA 2,3-dioxygenase component B
MVYLLHGFFGRDGREEAEELLARRSGDDDKPRILDAFNQECPDWLTFFCFTTFTDRDGKYQLGALAESAFDPLSRTCRFMLTEEAHHLFVGQTGVERVLRRAVQLAKADPTRTVREQGGVPLEIVQRFVNFWFSYSLDLFGSEVSSNAADFFAAGLKGRWKEDQYDDHTAMDRAYTIPHLQDGRIVDVDVPMRNAMNEVLRDEYVKDCEKVLEKTRVSRTSRSRCPRCDSTVARASTPTPTSIRRATPSRPRSSRPTAQTGCPPTTTGSTSGR